MSERRTTYLVDPAVEARGRQIIWLKAKIAACEAGIRDLVVHLEETRSALESTENERQIYLDLLCEKYEQQGAINAALY